jgi:MFS family permease
VAAAARVVGGGLIAHQHAQVNEGSIWSPSRWVLTVAMIGLVTAVAFEGMAVPTILPATVDELGQLELYGWAFSAFWLTNIVGITLAGGDADHHGPGRSFAIGLVLFAIGLFVSGLAGSMTIVILGRAIQGIGSGAIGAVVYLVIARAYPPAGRARMVALLSSAWVVPGLVGPALAGVIADSLSWRWVFVGLVPAVLLMGGAVLRPVWRLGPPRDGASATGSRRAVHAIGLALGSTLLLAGLSAGSWLLSIALLAAGLGLAVTGLRPLLPAGSMLLRRGRPAVFGVIFLVGFGFFGAEAFVPLAVTAVRGGSTTLGGLALSASAVTWAIGSWLPTRLARVERWHLVAAGTTLIAAGVVINALALLPRLPVLTAALGWAVAGLGMGLAYSTLTLLVLQTAEPGREGASSSGLQLMFTLGTALGAGAGGALVALSEVGDISVAAAIAAADGVMVVVIAAAALLAGRLPRGAVTAPAMVDAHIASPAGAVGPYED